MRANRSVSGRDPLMVLRGAEPVSALAFRDRDSLIAGTTTGSVLHWSLRTRRIVAERKLGKDSVRSVMTLSSSLDHIVVLSGFVQVSVLNVSDDLRITQTSQVICHGLATLARWKSPDVDSSFLLPTGHATLGRLCIGSLSSVSWSPEAIQFQPPPDAGIVTCIDSLPEANVVALGFETAQVLVLRFKDSNTLERCVTHQLCDVERTANAPVFTLGISENQVIVGTALDRLWRLDIAVDTPSEHVGHQSSIKLTNPGVTCLCISESGNIVVTCGRDGRIRVFSVNQKSGIFKERDMISFDVMHKFSALAYRVGRFAAGYDKMISIWSDEKYNS